MSAGSATPGSATVAGAPVEPAGAAPPPAVLLDMDGTLLDLAFDDRVWNHALPAALAARDATPLATARARVADTLATARGTLAWYCLDHWERVFGVSVHALEVAEQAHIDVRQGTREFLDFLAARDLPVILATNAHPQSLARKMARTGLAGYFRAIVSSHDIGAPKELPAFWQGLRARVPFDPANALFVDDSAPVLRAARAAGIRHIFGVRTPSSAGGPRSFDEFASVEALAELIPWLAHRIG